MLSKKSLALGRHLAVALENYDLSNPRETIFDDPIRYSMPQATRTHQQGTERRVALESAAIDIGDTAEAVNTSGFSAHDAAMDDATQILMQGLIKQFGYVRNTVLPVIGKVADDCLERVKTSEPKEYEIVEYEASDLLKSNIVREVLKKYTTNTSVTRVVRNGPERETQRLVDNMKTGIPELDAAIASALGKYGVDVVLELYNGVFRNEYNRASKTEASAEIYRLLQKNANGTWSLNMVGPRHADLALVFYFLVDSLVNEPMEATGLGLRDYETSMVQLRHAAGFLALQAINRYETDLKRGQLIISRPISSGGVHFSAEGATIVVYGEIYRRGVEQGLSTEVVIGGAIQKDNFRLLNDYLSRKDVFLRSWEMAVKEREVFARKTMTSRLLNALVEATAARLGELPDDAFPSDFSRQEKAVALRNHAQDVDRFFKDWDTEDLPNVYDLVCDKLCKFVFDFVDAKFIIEKLNDEMSANEELPPQDAAFIAAAKYLMYWAASNFTVQKQ